MYIFRCAPSIDTLRDTFILNDALDYAQDSNLHNDIYILPPVNANDEVTDEDSGEEDDVDVSHLTRNQLCAAAEIDGVEVRLTINLYLRVYVYYICTVLHKLGGGTD